MYAYLYTHDTEENVFLSIATFVELYGNMDDEVYNMKQSLSLLGYT